MQAWVFWYMAGWGSFLLLCLGLAVARRRDLVLLRRDYWRFLARPWKLATFAVAATGLTLIAPYTGDPTWDYVDALFMSVLAFTTAPWAVGALYRSLRRGAGAGQAVVALGVWLFSTSWSYDLWVLYKLGFYPPTWASNIVLSSFLYAAAGLFWNLEHREGRGVHLAFWDAAWPDAADRSRFGRLLWWAVPLMILVAAMILPFLWRYL